MQCMSVWQIMALNWRQNESKHWSGGMITLANMSNGLAYPHDMTCYFQSQHGHRCKTGYFAHNAMPWDIIIAMLKGYEIEIIDATRRKKILTDALRYGVPTFCLVFNRAIGLFTIRRLRVCDWQTPDMVKAAHGDIHKPLVQSIRKLIKYYGWCRPAVIGDNVHLTCHQNFIADDNPKRIKELVA